jgi:hypothetical protein
MKLAPPPLDLCLCLVFRIIIVIVKYGIENKHFLMLCCTLVSALKLNLYIHSPIHLRGTVLN